MRKKYDRRKYTLPSRYEVSEEDLTIQEVAEEIWDYLPDETIIEKLPEWLRFFKTNYDTIGFDHNITELPPIKGSALIVDKSMASTKFYEQVEHLKNYKGTLIVCDRALSKVLEYRIPDYVMQLDSSPLCWTFFDLEIVKKHMKQVKAIFATTTNTLTIRRWSGPRYYFTPYIGSKWLTLNLMAKSNTPTMNTGGQVATACWIFAVAKQANPVAIFGITNSYDEIGETEYPGVKHRKVKNTYGTFWLDPVYERYAQVHHAYIRCAKEKLGIETVNTMQSGVMYSEHITDMSLKEFVERFNT